MALPAALPRAMAWGTWDRHPYTHPVSALIALIVLIVLIAGVGTLLWWGGGLTPTRPRPGSRHRGSTESDVHQRLEERRRRP